VSPAVFVFALLGATEPDPGCTAGVRGRVVDVVTADAVPNASIALTSSDGGRHAVQTDDDGHYALLGVCTGRWTLVVTRADYESHTVTLTLDRDVRTDLALPLQPHAVERLEDLVVEALAPLAPAEGMGTTLDERALAEHRGQALADAIAQIPGTAVLRTSAGGLGKPILRGQVGRRTLLVYDGVRHEGQQWGLDHAPELDPFAAGSITVVKSAGAIRYGTDAVGGIVLVDPIPMATRPGISGAAHLVGDSNGLGGSAALRVDGAHRRVPGFAWRIEGNTSRHAALRTPDYPLDNTGAWTWNAGARLSYERSRVGFDFSYRHHFMRAGICSCLRADSPEDFARAVQLGEPIGVENYRADFEIEHPMQEVAHDIAIARSRASVGNVGEVVLTYAFQDDRRREYDSTRSAITGPLVSFDLRTHWAEIVLRTDPAPLGRAVVDGDLGVVWQQQRNAFTSVNPLLPDYTQGIGSFFARERVSTRRVDIEVGARFDGLTRVATLDAGDYADPDACVSNGSAGSSCFSRLHTGSAAIHTHVRPILAAPTFVVSLDLGSTGRLPGAEEQFLNGGSPSFPIVGRGAPTLGVERTWSSGITLAYANAWIAVEGAGYFNGIEDYIYFAPAPSGDTGGCQVSTQGCFPVFEYMAIDATFFGGEGQVTVHPPKWPVAFDGTATFVRARDWTRDTYLAFIPPDRYRFGLTVDWPDRGRVREGFVSAHGVVVDRQRRAPGPEEDFAPPPGAYGLLEVSTGFAVDLGENLLRLSLSGTNLTNTRYRDYTSLLRYFADEPGWALTVRASLDFAALPRRS